MRILLAAPEDRTVLGTIGRNCRDALVEMNNEVSVFDFRKRPYSGSGLFAGLKKAVRRAMPLFPSPYDIFPGFNYRLNLKINREFRETALNFKPELILVLFGENIFPQTMSDIRKGLDVPYIVNWFHDTLLSAPRRRMLERVISGYDILFTVDSRRASGTVNISAKRVEVLPLACNPRVHRKIELTAREKDLYGSDVAFVGTVTPDRLPWLEQLAGFDLKIWGRWSGRSKILEKCYRKKDVYGEEAAKIYNASRIVIDMHSLWGRRQELFNVTPRVFEVPACGGFLLTNRSEQLNDLYKPEEEMVVYNDIGELKRLISYYLGHERQRLDISARAYARAHKEHTYRNRLETLLEIVKGNAEV